MLHVTLFAVTIFTSAFLLFQVQPLIGKYILPWFGGSPAVWTACLLFFQTALLAGYAYAHGVATWLRPRGQAAAHVLLLAGAVALLPVIPGERWKPPDPSYPTVRILGLLAATLGLPFLALSATAPLLQAWFARVRPGASPYRLYALSNAGSLLALVSYPFLIEPALSRRHQAVAWSAGLAGFAVLCGACAVFQARRVAPASVPVDEPPAGAATAPVPTWLARLLWLALPACASVLLLGTTNTLTQDVAAVPFLWVLPLALYLLTFIICFDHPRWYDRRIFAAAVVPAAGLFVWLLFQPLGRVPIDRQVLLYGAVLFVLCMACHGELARLRPDPRRLTGYYLAISAGGALGGVFVALAAPRLFSSFAELRWGVFTCCMLLLIVLATDRSSALYRLRPAWAWFMIVTGVVILGGALAADIQTVPDGRVIARSRNFYGVMTVAEVTPKSAEPHRILLHGRVIHGLQFQSAERRRQPFSYYAPHGGLGLAMDALQARSPRVRVGVVGLGTGSVAAFGRAGDSVRFYEIDSDVERAARTHFTYLGDSPAHVSVVLGDGRLSLEREATQGFDVLVLDAFSGDSLPVHLLTREAFQTYTRHLAPGGLLAVNLTNKYLDLRPIAAALAGQFGFGMAVLEHEPAGTCPPGEYPSSWALMTRDHALLEVEAIRAAAAPAGPHGDVPLWTDDRTNLFTLLRREPRVDASGRK